MLIVQNHCGLSDSGLFVWQCAPFAVLWAVSAGLAVADVPAVWAVEVAVYHAPTLRVGGVAVGKRAAEGALNYSLFLLILHQCRCAFR